MVPPRKIKIVYVAHILSASVALDDKNGLGRAQGQARVGWV